MIAVKRTGILAVALLILTILGTAKAGPLEDAQAAFERRDYATALELLRPLAEQGDAEAQYNLGVMYANGRGVPQDYAEAVKWYRLAAEQGLAEAQYNLGNKYRDGLGVPQDDAEAVRWHRLAAEQGLADAQFNLGNKYRNGQGVPQDDAEAVKWYRLAAEQGLADAQYNLGMLYAEGQGAPQDDAEAAKWFRLSAEQGDAEAQYNLGNKYRDGLGVPQDDTEAVKWSRLSAEQGYANAQINLGVAYANGKGVPQDYVQAYLWFTLASEFKYQGMAAARLTPAQVAEAQRLARDWKMMPGEPIRVSTDTQASADLQVAPVEDPVAEYNAAEGIVYFSKLRGFHVLRVFSLSGDLVAMIDLDGTTQQYTWGVTGDGGEGLPHGMYLYTAEGVNGIDKKVGKVALVQ